MPLVNKKVMDSSMVLKDGEEFSVEDFKDRIKRVRKTRPKPLLDFLNKSSAQDKNSILGVCARVCMMGSACVPVMWLHAFVSKVCPPIHDDHECARCAHL